MIPQEFVGKDAKWFCGEPPVRDREANRLGPLDTKGTPQPFMTGYTIVIDEKSAIVYEGTKKIAWHWWVPTSYTWVEPAYRQKGIQTQMIRVCALAHPGRRLSPAGRPPFGQRGYIKAFELIMADKSS